MKINWTKPDLKSELGEYFENDFTKSFFKTKGLIFDTYGDLTDFLEKGILFNIYPKKLDADKTVNMTLTKEEFENELKDPEYKKSFDSMESALLEQKTITLPAPIIINFSGLFFGFSGNRRTNLSIKHNIPLQVWKVDVSKRILNKNKHIDDEKIIQSFINIQSLNLLRERLDYGTPIKKKKHIPKSLKQDIKI